MELPSYFEKFLREIRPTQRQKEDYINGHKTLRDRLNQDEDLKDVIVSTFLQGSYRRATAVRPQGDTRADVDVVVITNLNKNDYPDPEEAMNLFVPFLKKHYKGKYRKQGRSFGIQLSYVDLDLVITAAPPVSDRVVMRSTALITYETPEDSKDWRLVESWIPESDRSSPMAQKQMALASKEIEQKTEPLWIPNRDIGDWEQTNPIEQIKWTWGKNARCNRHYVNVVKALKWWQRINHENDCPTGYPLEHLIGDCCPDSIGSVSEGLTLALESAVLKYAYEAENEISPNLTDRGVNQNVFSRVSGEDFAKFYDHVVSAAEVAREAFNAETVSLSATKWRELLGDKFPPPPDDDNGEKALDPKGPFIAAGLKSQTGDLSPRKYGFGY